ncbi:MAG: hypothetical protein EOP50_00565 [Sphingobacteriales bacterium]|nr:MAG: hypothetical protein EOP50_00565 [Sphingobacteriales bacterium]
MQYVGKLRENQIKIMNSLIPKFEETGGGILVAGCGIGKTNMAIYLACNKKLKTLFLTHKTFLKNQIIERIVETTNIKLDNLIIFKWSKVNESIEQTKIVCDLLNELHARGFYKTLQLNIYKIFEQKEIDYFATLNGLNKFLTVQFVDEINALSLQNEPPTPGGFFRCCRTYPHPTRNAHLTISVLEPVNIYVGKNTCLFFENYLAIPILYFI